MRTRIPAVIVLLMGGMAALAQPPEYPPRVQWDTPGADSNGSMPLGNGDIGLNAWVEENGDLLFYLSKTDAWSGNGRLLKLGRIRVSLSPALATKDASFRQILDTERGCIEIAGGAGDGACTLRLWVDANAPAVRIETACETPRAMRASFECWRNAPRTLMPEERDSAYGLAEGPDPIVEEADTVLTGGENAVVWCHRNESSIWASTLRMQDMADWTARGSDPLLHRTFGGWMQGAGFIKDGPNALQAPSAKQHALSIHVLTAQTADAETWAGQLRRLVAADTASRNDAWTAHTAWWHAFWNRSWIRLSGPGTEPVNRAYALQRFITACAGRGGSPIKFNGSIFTVDAEKKGRHLDADYRQWGGTYWFQNTRLVYWPMLAAGDFEMMQPLFLMYRAMLPFAASRTRAYFGHEGAFFPETLHFWGAYAQDNYGWKRTNLAPGITENTYIRYYYSSALELLMMMLEFQAFTGDEAFVRETLLPFADAALAFYDRHYPRDAQGRLRIAPSQALETWQKAVNPLPPIAGLRRATADLLALPERLTSESERGFWRRLAAELPELPRGTLKGESVLTAAAQILEEAKNSENPELYAVFPYRLFGVGKPELDLARHTFAVRHVKGCNGWRQDETQAALLGLAEEARKDLMQRVSMKHEKSRFPAFWGPNFDWVPDQDHGGNAMMALQTMLLQHEGRALFLFPAWPKDWDVEFRLHAPCNTTIEGMRKNGKLEQLQVTPPERREDLAILEAQ